LALALALGRESAVTDKGPRSTIISATTSNSSSRGQA
jgi:hypothetical protein